MPHPTPQNFVQAIVMILDEYVEESQHAGGVGEPYEGFDEIDGLTKLAKDFGFYLQHRDWDDVRDNGYLTDKHTTNTVMRMLSPRAMSLIGKSKEQGV